MGTTTQRSRTSRLATSDGATGDAVEANIVTLLIEAIDELRPKRDKRPAIYILAERIGVTYQAIQKWERTGRVPSERVLDAERAVRRRYRRTDIRPDLYPPRKPRAQVSALST